MDCTQVLLIVHNICHFICYKKSHLLKSRAYNQYHQMKILRPIDWSKLFLTIVPYEPGHDKMSYFICEQQRCRSACASEPFDQLLCCSLLRQYISRFYSRNFKTLASFCGCTGRFVSGLVGNSQRHVLSCHGTYIYIDNKNSWLVWKVKSKNECLFLLTYFVYNVLLYVSLI